MAKNLFLLLIIRFWLVFLDHFLVCIKLSFWFKLKWILRIFSVGRKWFQLLVVFLCNTHSGHLSCSSSSSTWYCSTALMSEMCHWMASLDRTEQQVDETRIIQLTGASHSRSHYAATSQLAVYSLFSVDFSLINFLLYNFLIKIFVFNVLTAQKKIQKRNRMKCMRSKK